MTSIFKPPSRWGREPRCSIFAALVGGALGGFLSWWIAAPPTPWLEFEHLSATTSLGETEIHVAGVYRVNKLCNNKKFPPVWRTEAITTDGHIALYAPYPKPLPLDVLGEHSYVLPLKLIEPLSKNGARVRVTVSCAILEPDPIISPSVPVVILDFTKLPP